MEIVLFLLGCFGFTNIMVESKIMQPFRNLADKILPEYVAFAFHCYTCMGFWVSGLCAWMVFSKITYWQIFIAACAGSGLSNSVAIFLNYLEAQSFLSLKDTK